MSQLEIDGLTYEDGAQSTLPVPVPARAYLRILKAYHAYRHETGDPIGDAWTAITAEQFDEFRVADYNVLTMGSTSGYTTVHSTPTPTGPPATSRPRDPVADFKKGIKRDPSLFPIFKMEKQWISWQRSVLAQARAQDVADVLDPTYAASSLEDKLLFEE